MRSPSPRRLPDGVPELGSMMGVDFVSTFAVSSWNASSKLPTIFYYNIYLYYIYIQGGRVEYS